MKIQLRSAIVAFAVVAVIGSGIVVPAAANAAVPASAGSAVQVLKNRDCGWGIKTKYHSCDLAYSLVLQWVGHGNYPDKLRSVFSPNSGKRYDVKCTGVKTVTCKSNKGSVTFKPRSVPPRYKCGLVSENEANRWGWAWLGSSCQFVLAAIQSYKAGPSQPGQLTVADPNNGMVYEMVCFDGYYGPFMCLSGKKAVLFAYDYS